jgi:hypothetical protein
VIADLYAAPVTSDEFKPLLGGAPIEGFGGEVVADLFFVCLVGG